jgi:heme exporter protein C
MSIRWWRTQHPAPVFGGGADSGIDPGMVPAVLWNVVGWAMWGTFVLGLRYAIERRRQRQSAEDALGYLGGDPSLPEAR